MRRERGGRQVLAGIDLAVDEPALAVLLGANGAGKTTLLRCVAQLLQPDAGEIVVAGRLVHDGDDATARRLVGLLPHEPLAWRDETVHANLAYAARLAGLTRRAARRSADEAVDRWALTAVASRAMRELSRGWNQRCALARVDLLRPPVLLLDEPTAALDDAGRAVLDEALASWRRDRVVVVATHERDRLAAAADRVLELCDGTLRELVPAAGAVAAR